MHATYSSQQSSLRVRLVGFLGMGHLFERYERVSSGIHHKVYELVRVVPYKLRFIHTSQYIFRERIYIFCSIRRNSFKILTGSSRFLQGIQREAIQSQTSRIEPSRTVTSRIGTRRHSGATCWPARKVPHHTHPTLVKPCWKPRTGCYVIHLRSV